MLLVERSNDAVQKSFCIQAIASLEVLSLYWKVKCKMEGLSDLWTYVVFTHIVKGIYLRKYAPLNGPAISDFFFNIYIYFQIHVFGLWRGKT